MCPQVMENSALHAVVGFDDTLTPQIWNMTEGNLLATCKTGVAMNYMGCTTVLISMLLRFAKEGDPGTFFSPGLDLDGTPLFLDAGKNILAGGTLGSGTASLVRDLIVQSIGSVRPKNSGYTFTGYFIFRRAAWWAK